MKNKFFIFCEKQHNGSFLFKAYNKSGELVEKQNFYFYNKKQAKNIFIQDLKNKFL